MDDLHQKKAALEQDLRALGRVAVAFSAGVDSTFLLKTAHDTLGDNVIAVTVCAPSVPARELAEAERFCEAEGIELIEVEVDQLAVEGFAANPPDRCYRCKRALFTELIRAADDRGFFHVAEGSNADDVGDYRPGLAAIAELGVKSPLRQAGLTKAEIRLLSKELGLPTWNKPSFACLATRFPYGEPITQEKLRRVEQAEQKLFELGFRQVRVRSHGAVARIEIEPAEFERLVQPELAASLNAYFRQLGFSYAALDLGGYVTGSMNKLL